MNNKRRKKPLRFTHLCLENWRNFTHLDVDLPRRVFLLGPNASGKSNLLDVFRFLHDIAFADGRLLTAVSKPWRGSVAKLKSLAARHHADIGIHVSIGNDRSPRQWEYELRFAQDNVSLPRIKKERVVKQGKELLGRPNKDDEKDPHRLTQTYLEQVSVNQEFRDLAEFFASVSYLHPVPQVLRNLIYASASDDPFGGQLLRRIAALPEDVRQERFAIIRDALRAAVPQLKKLEFWTEPAGKKPHLRAEYEHLQGTWQLEDQFSDGTLRLIGLLWALLEGDGPLLLEEPEISLHPAVVRYLPYLFHRVQRGSGRQVMMSTYSAELLRDEGIGLDEVLLLQPGADGTSVRPASDLRDVTALVEAGINAGEATLPHAAPATAQDLAVLGG